MSDEFTEEQNDAFSKGVEKLTEALDFFEESGCTKMDVETELKALLKGRSF